jgi:hypothetical protein
MSFQVLLAEVVHGDAFRQVVADQSARRFREQDLPAVAGGRDARGAYYIQAEIALVAHCGLTGVEAHADANVLAARPAVRRQPSLCVDRSRDGVARTAEREEEAVPLRVDLRPVLRAESLADDAAVVARHVRVPIAELLKKPRGAFDVRKDEGDRAGREGR